MNEEEWLSLPQSIPGTWARAEQTAGTALCGVTCPVLFRLFSSAHFAAS